MEPKTGRYASTLNFSRFFKNIFTDSSYLARRTHSCFSIINTFSLPLIYIINFPLITEAFRDLISLQYFKAFSDYITLRVLFTLIDESVVPEHYQKDFWQIPSISFIVNVQL